MSSILLQCRQNQRAYLSTALSPVAWKSPLGSYLSKLNLLKRKNISLYLRNSSPKSPNLFQITLQNGSQKPPSLKDLAPLSLKLSALSSSLRQKSLLLKALPASLASSSIKTPESSNISPFLNISNGLPKIHPTAAQTTILQLPASPTPPCSWQSSKISHNCLKNHFTGVTTWFASQIHYLILQQPVKRHHAAS